MIYRKGHGAASAANKVECLYPQGGTDWRIRFNIDIDGEDATYIELQFDSKPSISVVKDAILDYYNEECDKKILEGYIFDGANVWMSMANQINYKAAYDLAVQSNGASLPITIKLGSNEYPVYHKFETVDDISAFYLGAVAWVQQCTAECWVKKDSIDWSEYEEVLT